MTLGLFTSCTGCGADLDGGPGLCASCALEARGGVLPCSTCNGVGCEACAFSGEAAGAGWNVLTWPEGEVRKQRSPQEWRDTIEARTGERIDLKEGQRR